MSVYTHQNLVKVFAEVKNQFGKYDAETWRGTMPQVPIIESKTRAGMSRVKEDLEKYLTIVTITDKHFKTRKPKSWKSLAMQVAICLSTQKTSNMEQSSIETRGRNRLAAYEAGFLTMGDIIVLEGLEK